MLNLHVRFTFQWPGLGDIGEGSTAGHSYCEDVTSPIHQGLQHSLVSIPVADFIFYY